MLVAAPWAQQEQCHSVRSHQPAAIGWCGSACRERGLRSLLNAFLCLGNDIASPD